MTHDTLNATTAPSKATAPWPFQQHSLSSFQQRACREYRCPLFYKISYCTSRRRHSVNAPSLLNHIKFHPFQKGKCGSFALCLEPTDVTNKKASSFQQRGTSTASARKSTALSHRQAQVGDTTEAQQYQCTVLFHL